MIAYTQLSSPPVSRRTMTFLLVACLHAAVLYGLLVHMIANFKVVSEAPLVPHFIDPPRAAPPPTPGPQMTSTTIHVPTLPDVLRFEREATDVDVVITREPAGPTSPLPAPHVINRVQGGPGAGFPSANDFYPSAAIFHGEQGVATLRACVDGRGRLTSDPTIIQSSGSRRLDEGAVRLAKAGSGHYLATTEDGQPIDSCYPFRIRFDLRN